MRPLGRSALASGCSSRATPKQPPRCSEPRSGTRPRPAPARAAAGLSAAPEPSPGRQLAHLAAGQAEAGPPTQIPQPGWPPNPKRCCPAEHGQAAAHRHGRPSQRPPGLRVPRLPARAARQRQPALPEIAASAEDGTGPRSEAWFACSMMSLRATQRCGVQAETPLDLNKVPMKRPLSQTGSP